MIGFGSPLVWAALWAAVVAAGLARAVIRFSRFDGPGDVTPSAPCPSIGVIVPARNEAANIADCLAGLRAQDYPADRHTVTVVDDGSTDDTPGRARGAVRGATNFRVVEAGPLPPGWFGKPHACEVGVAALGTPAPEWLCFLDADTLPRPPLLTRAVAAAEARDLDLLSLVPAPELTRAWERWFIPNGYCFIGLVAWDADDYEAGGGATGQFLLVRRDVYEAAGGFASVRDQLGEDTAFVGRIASAGYRVAVLDGAALYAARLPATIGAAWDGLARNLLSILRGPRGAVFAATVAVISAVAAIAVPCWTLAALFAPGASVVDAVAAALGCGASLALLLTHIAAARRFGVSPAQGVSFPLVYLLGAAIALYGVRQASRHGLRWKGRACTIPAGPGPGPGTTPGSSAAR